MILISTFLILTSHSHFIHGKRYAPIAIDADRFTEPKGLVSSKNRGPNDNDNEDNGLGIAYPPDPNYLEHDEDDIPGSGLDALRNRGIRITKDEIRGGDGRIISRRTWD
jgi:hypothetical protein